MVHQGFNTRKNIFNTVLFTQLLKTLFSDTQGRGLRVHITYGHVGCSYIRADKIDQALIRFAFIENFNTGKLQSLLINFGGVSSPAACGHSTHFCPVALIGRKCDNLSLKEYRHYEGNIR